MRVKTWAVASAGIAILAVGLIAVYWPNHTEYSIGVVRNAGADDELFSLVTRRAAAGWAAFAFGLALIAGALGYQLGRRSRRSR